MAIPLETDHVDSADMEEHSSDEEGGAQTPGEEQDRQEAFSNLRDERTFEDERRRRAVQGEQTVIEGEQLEANEAILVDLPDDATDLELTHLKISTLRGLGLERFRGAQRISLRQNLLKTLSYDANEPLADETAPAEGHTPDLKKPLSGLRDLEELDLYDNLLKSVDGLEHLPSITSLDLSFNLIRSVAQFDDSSPDSPYAYPKLEQLFLIQNKLTKIHGVKHRTTINYLEFGGNRIRVIENLPHSTTLIRLFLGKNKITKLEGLDGLPNLRTLSLQSNRLTRIEGLDKLAELEELYLSHNGLTEIEGLENNTKLNTLDVGNNKLTKVNVEALAHLSALEEFWANDNQIEELPVLTQERHPNLETVYLAGNPIEKTLGSAYRRRVQAEMPQLKQIDATYVRQS